MKAMIFAAGVGSRLRPFTLHHPKALAPVGGIPMLERVILKLKAAGISEMVVNVHHFSDQIVDFLRQHDNFGVNIHISDESSLLLDTGGGLLAARQWLDDDDFLVHNADILSDFPIQEIIDNHLQHKSLATLLVAHRSTSRYLLMDTEMRMRGWTNVRSGEVLPAGLTNSPEIENLEKYAFGGVHVLSPQIFPLLKAYSQGNKVFSIMPFYIEACSSHSIKGFVPSKPYMWIDIGKPDTLEAANTALDNYEKSRIGN